MSDMGTTTGERFEGFVGTIARLRSPQGCPWDREQTHASIARNMIEEAYEAVDAIERDDKDDLREELGDVLLQVVLQSQIASDEGAFCLDDVIADVNDKMIRRHPHVFGVEAAFAAAHLTQEQLEDIEATETPGQVIELWDRIKLIEKRQKAERRRNSVSRAERALSVEMAAGAAKDPRAAPKDDKKDNTPRDDKKDNTPKVDDKEDAAPRDDTKDEAEGLLDGIPRGLPALMQAQDISRKAVSAGFEWPDVASVWEQVAAEIEEYRAEKAGSPEAAREFGDVLFSLVNVARKEGIDAESALRSTCRTFRERWAIMEDSAEKANRRIFEYSVEELEELWKAAKLRLKEVRQ